MFEQQKVQNIQEQAIAVESVLAAELEAVDFGETLEQTDHFEIRPTIVVERSGQRLAVYGIYNKATGVREAESRQFGGAQEWLRVLSNDADGLQEDLPGLVTEKSDAPTS